MIYINYDNDFSLKKKKNNANNTAMATFVHDRPTDRRLNSARCDRGNSS